MSKYSPNHKLSQQIDPDQRKLEKSKTHAQQLQRTPSTQFNRPYLEQLDARPTDKKRKQYPTGPFNAPILLEQNKMLLAQNRQMAMLIHQKNRSLQLIQEKYDQKVQNQIYIFKEVESEKERFIAEVIQRKNQTDRQVSLLTALISQLQSEKQGLELKFQKDQKEEQLDMQKQHLKQIEQLNIQYQQNLGTSQAQRLKLKEQLEHKNNELQIKELENKQKIDALTQECASLKDENKHIMQIKKLELQETKHFYENKIQKMHLDHRRDKELFLAQHESQVKKGQSDFKRLNIRIQELEMELQKHKDEAKITVDCTENVKQQMKYQTDNIIFTLKQQSYLQRTKIQSLLKTQASFMEISLKEESKQLILENEKLMGLLSVKNSQISKLLAEIDRLRQQHLLEIEDNQAIVQQLQSKMFTSLLEGEEESEALKVKLATLREADLRGLRQYHEHQLQILCQSLQEKQVTLVSNRHKYHEQLRRKAEMRKHFDIQLIKYKSTIAELEDQTKSLRAQLRSLQNQLFKQEEISSDNNKQQKAQLNIQKQKNDQCRHLHQIIIGKDDQIQELGRRLQLLKEHHQGQRMGWERQLQGQREKSILIEAEKAKEIEYYQLQISKIKLLLKSEQEEYERQLELLKDQKRSQLDETIAQLIKQKQERERSDRQFINQIKRLNIERQHLNHQLEHKQNQIKFHKEQSNNIIINQSSREREILENFYNDQLSARDAQIAELKERIEEMSCDLRDYRENYCCLEKKLEQLIQSQSGLREIQRKVIMMGKENNLTKNLKEIVK